MKSKIGIRDRGGTIRDPIFRQAISFAFGEQRALAASRFRWTGEPRWRIDLFSGVPSPQTQSNRRCRLKVYISLETDTSRYSYNTQFDQGILRTRIHTAARCTTAIDERPVRADKTRSASLYSCRRPRESRPWTNLTLHIHTPLRSRYLLYCTYIYIHIYIYIYIYIHEDVTRGMLTRNRTRQGCGC